MNLSGIGPLPLRYMQVVSGTQMYPSGRIGDSPDKQLNVASVRSAPQKFVVLSTVKVENDAPVRSV